MQQLRVVSGARTLSDLARNALCDLLRRGASGPPDRALPDVFELARRVVVLDREVERLSRLVESSQPQIQCHENAQ